MVFKKRFLSKGNLIKNQKIVTGTSNLWMEPQRNRNDTVVLAPTAQEVIAYMTSLHWLSERFSRKEMVLQNKVRVLNPSLSFPEDVKACDTID